MIRYAVTISVLNCGRSSTIVRIKRIIDTVTVCIGACGNNIGNTITVGIMAFKCIRDTITV